MTKSNSPVSQALNEVVKETYILLTQTHQHHWNVEGPMFVSLHELFEKQYNELFTAIDEVAERVRALDDYALPFKDNATFPNMNAAVNDNNDATEAAQQMVQELIEQNQKVIDACQKAKEEAVKSEDDETEDLTIERITAHQDAIWMLKSVIK